MTSFEILASSDAAQPHTYEVRLVLAGCEPQRLAQAPLSLIHTNDEAGGLAALATGIVDRLEELETGPGISRQSFWTLFSDPYLMQVGGNLKFLRMRLASGDRQSNPGLLALSAAFYKAVFLFLNNGERYDAREAWLASLYAAWQWYQLVKILLVGAEQGPDAPRDSSPVVRMERAKAHEAWQAVLRRELDSAYRYLVTLLDDPRFAQAIRWLARWRHTAEAQYGSGPLLREQLRLSLPLWEDLDLETVDPCVPIAAPGCLISTRPNWRTTRLHPAFTRAHRQRSVRRLITEWLLPRYDFSNAIWMAMLLRRNQAGLWPGWIYWFKGGWVLLPVLAVLVGSVILRGSLAQPETAVFWITVILQNLVGFCIPAALVYRQMQWSVVANFMLPRVIGGVFIGYLTLALESNSVTLSNVAWSRGPWLVAGLWSAVLAVGLLYLYFDTRPLVRDGWLAVQRAGWSLLMAVIISLLAGLMSVAITSAAYGIQTISTAPLGAFLGPFGWVDLSQYLTFVPVALFTGLVTQFVFEELTLPASVWSPEQE